MALTTVLDPKKINLRPLDLRKLGGEVADSAHNVFLAGLGAASTLESSATEAWKRLVDTGREIEQRGRQEIDAAVTRSRVEIDLAKTRVESNVDRVASTLDRQLMGALQRLGVPSRDEIEILTRRVEELIRQVESLGPALARQRAAVVAAEKATVATTAAAATDGPARKVYHVAPHDEGWKVEAVGASRATTVTGTKAEALEAARELGRNQAPSQIVIHRLDGTIQDSFTYDADAG